MEISKIELLRSLKWAIQYIRIPNFHPTNSYNAEQFAADYNKAKQLIDKGDIECQCTVT